MKKATRMGKFINELMIGISVAMFAWVVVAAIFEQTAHILIALGILTVCYVIFFIAMRNRAKKLKKACEKAYKCGDRRAVSKANREANEFLAMAQELGF